MEATHDEQFVINGVGQGVLGRTIACLFAHSFGEPIEFSGDGVRINGVPAKAGDDHRTAEEVHHGDTTMHRLCTPNPKRHLGRRHRVAANDDHREAPVERLRQLAASLRPVRDGGHGPPSYTQKDCLDSRPTRSASSFVAYGPITTR